VTLIAANLRDAVVQRAGNRCEYCHLSQESQVATFPVDHLLPISLSGLTTLENLALACPRCNSRKWKLVEAADADTGQVVPLFNPRVQVWLNHFRWFRVDSTMIEPTSAVGRATLFCLDMNSN
jgi:5-methylcytosine-specific restriction endonuclease McrA